MKRDLRNDSIQLNTSSFNDDSIMSEDEDSKMKYNNNFLLKSCTNKSLEREIHNSGLEFDQKDSLQNNLMIMSPDGIENGGDDNNKKRKYSEIMLEDVFSNLYIIPMNRPSKFSTSRMGHKFIYESNSKVRTFKIDSKKFGLSKNSEIITYLLSLFVFSEFANLEELSKDKRFKVHFIKQNKIQKQFIIEDMNSLLKSLEIPSQKINEFDMFIKGINDFLSENEYLSLQKKRKKKIISIYALISLLILLIISIGIATYFSIKGLTNRKTSSNPDDTKKEEIETNKASTIFSIVLEIISLLFFIFCLVIKIIDAKNLHILFIFYDLRYLLINYNKINEHIEIWNQNLFENYKIRVSVPISINYIMFNLNPYQNIEIKHHDMDWLKKKYYKSQNDLFKTEKEEKLFHLIKLSLFQNRERLSLSIN